jgi:serine/threonine-protein kinase
MLSWSGEVKLTDFGIASLAGDAAAVIGTPGYMAPEQAHRQAITPATDLYNFGATMYWVLVGEVIPTAMPPKEDQSGLYRGAVAPERIPLPTPPHERNPALHHLLSKQVMECIQLDPGARPDSMDRVATRLELIADLIANPVKERTISDMDESRTESESSG